METLWMINAFGEVDSISSTNSSVPELKKAGNLFATREEAFHVLQKIKLILTQK